jgi:hypothetical protein
MLCAADLISIKTHLDDGRHHVSCAADILVGRDTYPLNDDKIHDPFAFYVALEIERINGAITQLESNVKLEAEDATSREEHLEQSRG